MNKKLLFIIPGILILVGVGFFLLRARGSSKDPGKLKIDANPTATVFINNESVGKTPYEKEHTPGEYTIKLVPETTVGSPLPWENRIVISANSLTYVNRDLKDSEVSSAGEILTVEKISGSGSELSIVSTPDAAQVSIDGKSREATPVVISDLGEGNFEVSVSQIGFVTRTLKVKTNKGYKLNALFNLASTGTVQPVTPLPSPTIEDVGATPKPTPKGASPSPSSAAKASPKASSTTAKTTPPAKPYVQILDTPTNFLNVRAVAGSSGEIVARVNPDEYFSLLDEDTVASTPWYKIEYETGKEGWITSQYAKKTE